MCSVEMASVEFLSHIERVRGSLREKVAIAHQLLQERETALLSELQQLEDSHRRDDVAEQILELKLLRGNSIATLQKNENQDFLAQNVALLDARVRELEAARARDRMRRVELEWDGNLEGILSMMGMIRVRGALDYKEKGNPVVVAGKHRQNTSTTPGEFCYPKSIDIDFATNNIYICDGWNNRVQVYNESLDFLFTFSDNMNTPVGICVNLNKVYVTHFDVDSLTVYSTEGRYLETAGRYGNRELEFDYPRGIAVSTVNNLIYICEYKNYRIQCLNLDLTFNSFIFIANRPKYLKLTPQDIVVMTAGNPCIQFYSYSHELIREIITQGKGNQVVIPWYFCLDREYNILITDQSTNCVIVFSNKGELLHKFGKGRGCLIFPTGIALDREDRIIVVSRNPEHCIQLF